MRVQLQDSEIERFLDQLHAFFYELYFVAYESENHSDRGCQNDDIKRSTQH
jgi:hypothetical protein